MSDDREFIEEVREAYRTDQIGTHSPTCHLYHPRCAVLALCARLEQRLDKDRVQR